MVVLVTGGAGFIGSHVVDVLVAAGHEVVVVDNLSSGSLKNVNKAARLYECDVASADLEHVLRSEKIDYVCHLAAQSNVGVSVSDPTFDATNNIMGSINLYFLCRKYGVKKIVYCSSAAVYGDIERLPVYETDPLSPKSCYGLSKLTAEKYLHLMHPDSVVLRCANVYGPRQNHLGESGVIAIFSEKIASCNTVEVYGDGQQTRDFVYVEDVAAAFLASLNETIKGEVINVSSGTQTSINDLWQTLRMVANATTPHRYLTGREGEIQFSALSNQKAQRTLNWRPAVSLEEGLRRTLDHFGKPVVPNTQMRSLLAR